ncbi:site-specific integrase [Streptomyces sp. IBSBF 2953]|nr:site-specific integrase [Streptomyces hayashii]
MTPRSLTRRSPSTKNAARSTSTPSSASTDPPAPPAPRLPGPPAPRPRHTRRRHTHPRPPRRPAATAHRERAWDTGGRPQRSAGVPVRAADRRPGDPQYGLHRRWPGHRPARRRLHRQYATKGAETTTGTLDHLLGLRWEDLDLEAGTATIRRTLQRTRTGGLTALPTKTISSERRIALPAACVAALRAHRDRQAREKQQAGGQWVDNGFVFTRPDGHPIEPATLTGHFNAMLRRSHLRAIRFHDLRHSTATLLLEQGVELVVIKELLGHAHIGVTATVYAHVRLRLQRDAIDLLSRTLGKPSETAAEPDDGGDPPLGAASIR